MSLTREQITEIKKTQELLVPLIDRLYMLITNIAMYEHIGNYFASNLNVSNESFWGFFQARNLARLIAIDLLALLGEGQNELTFYTILKPIRLVILSVKDIYIVLTKIKNSFDIKSLNEFRNSYAAHSDLPKNILRVDLSGIKILLDDLILAINQVRQEMHASLTTHQLHGGLPQINDINDHVLNELNILLSS